MATLLIVTYFHYKLGRESLDVSRLPVLIVDLNKSHPKEYYLDIKNKSTTYLAKGVNVAILAMSPKFSRKDVTKRNMNTQYFNPITWPRRAMLRIKNINNRAGLIGYKDDCTLAYIYPSETASLDISKYASKIFKAGKNIGIFVAHYSDRVHKPLIQYHEYYVDTLNGAPKEKMRAI